MNALLKIRLLNRLINMKEDMASRASKLLTRSVRHAKNKTCDMQENLERYVAKKPYKALGIAVITSLCLGYWLKK